MSGPQISRKALLAVDPAKVAEKIADREAEVERQQLVVDWLRDQLDDEERALWGIERALSDLRDIHAQMLDVR